MQQYWVFTDWLNLIQKQTEANREVVTKELHDKCAVFVRVFIQRIQLSHCIIKCLLQIHIKFTNYTTHV